MVVFSIYDAKDSSGAAYAPPGGNGDDGRVGSLKVTSAQKLAGVVLEHATAESPATYVMGTRAFVPSDYDTKAYAPVVKQNWYGRFTGIQVQNPGTAAISATVTYKGSAGACAGNTYTDGPFTVPAGGAHTFVQYNSSTTNLPDTCYAAATITGTGQFVALVNEGAYAGGAGITYSAMPNKNATTKVSAPLYKDNYYKSTSGLGIENVGTAEATNVIATFSCNTTAGTSFTAVSKPQTIAAGGAFLFFRPSQDSSLFEATSPFASDGANCSVVVTSDQPIVAIVNEMGYGQAIDDNNYEGFNLAP